MRTISIFILLVFPFMLFAQKDPVKSTGSSGNLKFSIKKETNNQTVKTDDLVAPIITIENYENYIKTKPVITDKEFVVKGKVTDNVGVFEVLVNGEEALVDAKGNFSKTVLLAIGQNKIKVTATDVKRNSTTKEFSIERNVSVTNDITLNPSDNVKNEKRIALVIGNSNYLSAPLRNPVNDAKTMSVELKKLGFEVTTITNGTQNQMKLAISNYGTALSKDKNIVGLFYYAGHGMQVKGKNYLIPIDAKIEKEPDVEVYCVDMDGLLANLEYAGNNMNVIIMDACRNNPFARSFRSAAGNGLATVNAPTGTIIAFATAPGSVAADGDGNNGLYTQEFVKVLQTPNIKIEEVFKKVRTNVKNLSNGMQVPWENSALEGDFYFNLK